MKSSYYYRDILFYYVAHIWKENIPFKVVQNLIYDFMTMDSG